MLESSDSKLLWGTQAHRTSRIWNAEDCYGRKEVSILSAVPWACTGSDWGGYPDWVVRLASQRRWLLSWNVEYEKEVALGGPGGSALQEGPEVSVPCVSNRFDTSKELEKGQVAVPRWAKEEQPSIWLGRSGTRPCWASKARAGRKFVRKHYLYIYLSKQNPPEPLEMSNPCKAWLSAGMPSLVLPHSADSSIISSRNLL